MSDVQRCDGCGDIRIYHHTEYDFETSITDPETSPDAIDIRGSGHLCSECAREVAKTIRNLGDD